MYQDMFDLAIPLGSIIVRTTAVYLMVLAVLRLAGRRQIAQTGPTEFVAMLLVSNTVQNSMNGGDNSLIGGLVSAFVLIGCSAFISHITFRFPTLAKLIEGSTKVLISNGTLDLRNLAAAQLTVDDLKALLKLQSIEDLASIARADIDSEGRLIITQRTNKLDKQLEPLRVRS